MSSFKTLFCLLMIYSLGSCSDDSILSEDVGTNEGSKIQDQYKPYVDRFFQEAAKRKANIFDSRLYVLTGFPRPEYCGLGYYNYLGNGSQRVEISPEPSCWFERDDIEREILMFHELGHAMLERQHKEGNYGISLPISMMCSETCNGFWNLYNEFTPELREYYIDELFDPEIELPHWAINNEQEIVFEDDIDIKNSNWEFVSSNDSTGVYSSNNQDVLNDGNKTLSIEATQASDNIIFSFWRKNIENPSIPVGSTLRVSVEVTTQELEGNGISIALRTNSRADGDIKLSAFSSTQGVKEFNGNLNQELATVEIGYFPEKVESINVFLIMLNETKGKAYFDNIKLEMFQ